LSKNIFERMTRLNDLVKIKNLSLQEDFDANVTAVRLVKGYNDSYALNAYGSITALSVSESTIETLELGSEAVALEYLYLTNNKSLKKVVFEIPLPRLTHLYLDECVLEEITIPTGFAALQQIYVQKNELKKIVFQGDCPSLILMDASYNQLTELSIPIVFDKMEYLYLVNNVGTFNIPQEVYKDKTNCWQPVRDYLLELGKGGLINDRAKLIIVGNGRVGKTSIYRQLKGEEFNKLEGYTHGVEIRELTKDNLPDVKTASLQLNVWDFGGQHIFYATHQFFLSEEAVYLLAWTNEKNVLSHKERDKDTLPFDEKWRSCDYWLDNIRLHGKNSPIIMVQTNSDCREHKLSPEPHWNDTYNALNIDFSALKKYGLDELKGFIADKLNAEIPMFGKDFPKTYDAVIQAVERSENPRISLAEFYAICSTAQITAGAELSVLDYLAKSGIVVYYNDKPALKEVVFTNPNWLTQQVYRLINNALRTKKGRIDTAYLTEALPEYSDEQVIEFIELLKRFEMIFEAGEGLAKYYIAPQYLPIALDIDTQPLYDMIFEDLSLAFVFRFPKFMPDNIMINFLSRYGSYSNKMYWKNGICFANHKKAKCIVNYDENTQSLKVYTAKSPESLNLQIEILNAFVELGKNTAPELSLDDGIFVSLQELNRQATHYDYAENSNQYFFAVDGKTQVYVKDYRHLLNDRGSIGREQIGSSMSKDDFETNDRGPVKKPKNVEKIEPVEVLMQQGSKTFIPFKQIKGKIKILFLSANPDGSTWLRTDREGKKVKLEQRLTADKNRFIIFEEPAATVKEMHRAIVTHKPHVIHYSGHGDKDNIHLEDQEVTTALLITLFNLATETQLVILNACNTLPHAEKIAEHIPYVIGNDGKIDDKAAIEFAEGFYMSFFLFNPIEEAIKNGRASIEIAKLPDKNVPILVKGTRNAENKTKLQPDWT
jgi:internalin A